MAVRTRSCALASTTVKCGSIVERLENRCLMSGGTLTDYTDPCNNSRTPSGPIPSGRNLGVRTCKTVPASTFLDGTGINYSGSDGTNPDLVMEQLARHGIHQVRIEIGFNSIDYNDESRLYNGDSILPIFTAAAKWGIRPLILLNGNQARPAQSRCSAASPRRMLPPAVHALSYRHQRPDPGVQRTIQPDELHGGRDPHNQHPGQHRDVVQTVAIGNRCRC